MGYCKGSDAPTWDSYQTEKIPNYLYTGQKVTYICKEETHVIPLTFDQDSNFKIEVFCKDGSFQLPDPTPTACENVPICNSVPPIPEDSGLVRADSKIKFRKGEKAYFVCEDKDAVIVEFGGLNMFSITCPGDSYNFAEDIQWPKCTSEPICTDFPEPGEGLRIQERSGNVILGQHVVYECIRRDEFYEMPEGPEKNVLCDNPVVDGKGTTLAPPTWPTCKKLECTCLGDTKVKVITCI